MAMVRDVKRKKMEKVKQQDLDGLIEKYVPIINKACHREDKTEQTVAYFRRLMPYLQGGISAGAVVLYAVVPDCWGDRELDVLSFHLLGKECPVKAFRDMMRFLQAQARAQQVRRLVIGAHNPLNAPCLGLILKHYHFQAFSYAYSCSC